MPSSPPAVNERRPPRLTVRELQVALAAARATACPGPAKSGPRPDDDVPKPGSWLTERDGVVSLTSAVSPRRLPRTVARPAPSRVRASRQGPTAVPRRSIADAEARLQCHPAPKLAVLSAGGGGSTTLTGLLAAAAAPVWSTIAISSPTDDGALNSRVGADATDWAGVVAGLGDEDELDPGELGAVAVGNAAFRVAAIGRGSTTGQLDASRVLAAAGRSSSALVLDCPDLHGPFTERALAMATHVVVVAPHSPAGLLAAEYAVELAALDGTRPTVVACIDIQRRARTRACRAALSRARAMPAPVVTVPFDSRLADATAVRWPAIRPRTQAAVMAVLTAAILGGER